MDEVLKAGLSHLWFVTIRSFEDGNGRMARAIADMSLARSEKSPQRFYSMSSQIRRERSAYYAALERTQKGSLDVTLWMEWFLICLGKAIDDARTGLDSVLAQGAGLGEIARRRAESRQTLIVDGAHGFEGNSPLQISALARCSQDTALRDIVQLIDSGILVREPAGGRSTGYRIALTEEL